MRYYIGLDGGGSKTKGVLVNESLRVVAELTSGPSNFLVLGIGKAVDNLAEVISILIKADMPENELPVKVVAGVAGAGQRGDPAGARGVRRVRGHVSRPPGGRHPALGYRAGGGRDGEGGQKHRGGELGAVRAAGAGDPPGLASRRLDAGRD